MTNDTWGLNFTSPIDAKQFRECCVSRLDFRSHFRLFSFFLSLNPPCPTLPSFPTSIHPLLPSLSFRSLLCVLTCFLLISSFLHGKSKKLKKLLSTNFNSRVVDTSNCPQNYTFFPTSTHSTARVCVCVLSTTTNRQNMYSRTFQLFFQIHYFVHV